MKLLEKARADLPAKPTKASKTVAAPATKTGKAGGAKVVKPAAAPEPNDWEEEPMEKTAAAKGIVMSHAEAVYSRFSIAELVGKKIVVCINV